MPTIYSLRDFYNQVKELAAAKGIAYATAETRIDFDGRLSFRSYVDSYSAHTGDTPEESLAKLRNALYPIQVASTANDVQVVLEEEQSPTEPA